MTEKGGYCHYETNSWDCAVCALDSIQCGPYISLPNAKFTTGQYCYRGGPDSVCFGRSKSHQSAF